MALNTTRTCGVTDRLVRSFPDGGEVPLFLELGDFLADTFDIWPSECDRGPVVTTAGGVGEMAGVE